MNYLLLSFYTLIFIFLLHNKYIWKRLDVGFNRKLLSLIFVFKIMIGLLYGFIHFHYFNKGDTFLFLKETNLIATTFWDHFKYYIRAFFCLEVVVPQAEVFLYPSIDIYLKDFGSYFLVHLHAIIYPLTRGYFELNVFFLSIVSLISSLNIYAVFKRIFNMREVLLVLCSFCLPSLSFWTAGLHKDAYVFLGISFLFRGLLELQDGRNFKTISKVIFGLLIVIVFRNYLFLLLLPSIIAYLSIINTSEKQFVKFLMVYLSNWIIMFLTFFIVSDYSLMEILIERQAEFLLAKGSSSFDSIEKLDVSFWGTISQIPLALLNVISRPLMWECKDFLQFLASLEVLFFILIAIVSVIGGRHKFKQLNILIYPIIFYCLSNIILIGLLVSNVGTIVRYRSISLGLLFTVIVFLNARLFQFNFLDENDKLKDFFKE